MWNPGVWVWSWKKLKKEDINMALMFQGMKLDVCINRKGLSWSHFGASRAPGIWKNEKEKPWGWRKTRVHESQEEEVVQESERGPPEKCCSEVK